MSDVEIIVYDPAQIEFWEIELAALRKEIGENEQILLSLAEQNLYLKEINLQISIIKSKLEFLFVENMNDSLHNQRLNDHYYRHPHHDWYVFSSFPEDELRAVTRASLQATLERLYAQHTLAENKLDDLGLSSDAQEKIAKAKIREQYLLQHIPAAQSFVAHLKDKPANLVMALQQRIRVAIVSYESQYFLQRSPQVRLSLLALKYARNHLIEDNELPHPQRVNYLKLCGFLNDLYNKVASERLDEPFTQMLAQLIESTHVQPDSDFPSSWATGYTAEIWYNDTKKTKPILFSMHESELIHTEQRIFQRALDFLLQSHLPQNTQLRHYIPKAAWRIHLEVDAKKRREEPIDYHFYTQILHALTEIYHDPTHTVALTHLSHLTQHASGTSSVGKKVLGGLLVVLGLAVIGISIASFATTCGASSLLSAWGLSLGISLLNTQIGIGVGLYVTAAAGTGLTFWGAKTIHASRPQGLAKELSAIQKQANDSDVIEALTHGFGA